MTEEINIENCLEDFEEKSHITKKHYIARIEELPEEEPEDLIEEIPAIQKYLDIEERVVRENLLTAAGNVAKEYPEEVLPLVPELKSNFDHSLEEDETDNAIAASFALGMVAKEYPNVAEDSIPRFVEVTKLDNKYVSNNAMALIADLSREYQDEIVEYLPEFAEKLEAEDNYMRYNAITAISHVAKEYPDRVQEIVGVDRIKSMVDADEDLPRENACWALMYLGEKATEAVPALKEVSENDESERVRKVAEKAVHHIQNRDKDWKV